MQMRDFYKKWSKTESSQQEYFYRFVVDYGILRNINGWTEKSSIRRAKKIVERKDFVEQFDEADFQAVRENFELIELFNEGILLGKFPFAINPETMLFREMMEYRIQPTDTIIEIGAGSGTFSLMAALINRDSKIFINELDKYYLKYIETRLDQNRDLLKLQNIELIKGKKKSIGLDIIKFDKIIIRNTFHHFSERTAMLASIKNGLKKSGTLFVQEPVKDYAKNLSNCQKIMTRSEIIQNIEMAGFCLLKITETGGRLLFEFEIE